MFGSLSCRFPQWGPLFVGIGLTLCNPRLIASSWKCFTYITLEAVKSPILSVRKCDPLSKQFRFREWIVKGRHKFCWRSFLSWFIPWCTFNYTVVIGHFIFLKANQGILQFCRFFKHRTDLINTKISCKNSGLGPDTQKLLTKEHLGQLSQLR